MFLRAGHVTDTHIDFDGVERFHVALEPRVRSKLAKPGDAVITTKGNSTGRTTFVSPSMPPFVYSPHLSYWRSLDSNRIEGGFLRYWCKGSEFAEQLAGMKASTDMAPYLSLVDQKRLQITLPPVAEQRAVARILGTLDDKIELNRQMNETVEAMARAIFKSWFVDFDPVRAKAEGRDPGLPKHIADLFPDHFEESELGEIPTGWEIRSLYDCAEYINGSAFRNEHFSLDRSGLPVIKIAELKDGVTEQTKFTEATLDTKYRITSGDILFSWSGSPDTSIDTFIWVGTDGWLNQHIFKISFKRPEDKYFVYYLLRHFKPEFIEIARNKQTTGLGHVTAQDLKRLKTVFPSDRALREFNLLAEPLFQKVYSNHCESRQLTGLRDTLLPKLISGELRVKNAESFLEPLP